jgi:hypothetical protein
MYKPYPQGSRPFGPCACTALSRPFVALQPWYQLAEHCLSCAESAVANTETTPHSRPCASSWSWSGLAAPRR